MTATSATLSFSQPTSSLSVDMYTVTLTGTTCNGVPTRTGSTTSNSVTIGSLEAGIQYSVSVTGRNNLAELEGTGTATLTTSESGKKYCKEIELLFMRSTIGDNWLILKGYTTFLMYCIFSNFNQSESSVIYYSSTKFITCILK